MRRSARPRRGGSSNPFLVLLIVLTATFMQLVDVSIVNVAIPSIQRELAASYAAIQLVLAGYLLAFAVTLITAARLGDIYGRKRLFLTGLIGFTLASAACGAAPNPTVLVVARVVQGLMSGLMCPQVLSVIQVTFPPRERGKAFGIFGAVIGLATILGPLLGGVLIAWNPYNLDWRTIFYVNVPIGLASIIAAVARLGESRAPDAPRLDVPGALLVTVGLFLVVFPLVQGREQGWPLWVWIMVAAALPVLAAFTAVELRKTRRNASPLVDMTLFGDRAFRVGLVLTLIFFSGLAPFFFVISLYLQIGFGFSPLHAGLTTFPFAIGSGLASGVSDRLARRLGKRILQLGAGVLVVGMISVVIVVQLAGARLHSYQLSGVLFLSGIGLGLFVAPVINLILAGIHSRAAGSASGVLSTVQQVGAALGIAVVGVIFFGLLAAHAPAAARSVTPSLRADLRAVGLPPPAIDAVVSSFDRCFEDRARADDPSAEPPSCLRAREQAGQSGAPTAVRERLTRAVQDDALPKALRDNFAHAFARTLTYEIVVFTLAFLLVFVLPDPELPPRRTGEPRRGQPESAPAV